MITISHPLLEILYPALLRPSRFVRRPVPSMFLVASRDTTQCYYSTDQGCNVWGLPEAIRVVEACRDKPAMSGCRPFLEDSSELTGRRFLSMSPQISVTRRLPTI